MEDVNVMFSECLVNLLKILTLKAATIKMMQHISMMMNNFLFPDLMIFVKNCLSYRINFSTKGFENEVGEQYDKTINMFSVFGKGS
jgi:hypothetical protein